MVLASRGLRDLDTGPQRIVSADTRERLRRQARSVHLKSVLVAVIVTALLWLVPATS